MAQGAHHDPHPPFPHPEVARARDCEECRGWGTVVAPDPDGRLLLCPACQRPVTSRHVPNGRPESTQRKQ